MYWTATYGNRIRRADLSGANVDTLIDIDMDLNWPSGIALDVAGGKMYWTETGGNRIRRADLSGDNMETIVTMAEGGLVDPSGIALDVENNMMYWTDQGSDRIQRANMDGTGPVENLVIAHPEPGGVLGELIQPGRIALDLWNRKMYWTDEASPGWQPQFTRIRRADLDGSNREDLINTGLADPYGIALGPLNAAGEKKMYWVDYGTLKIERANLDDLEREDFITGLSGTPSTIALEIR